MDSKILYAVKVGSNFVGELFVDTIRAKVRLQDAYLWHDKDSAKRIASKTVGLPHVVPVSVDDFGNRAEFVELIAYKNTNSTKGYPVKYFINPLEIVRINTWINSYGNPSYGFHMDDGTTYLLVDSYGAMNGIYHLSPVTVQRKKELV